MNGVRVYHRELFGNVDFEWQRQDFRGKRRVVPPVRQYMPKGICQGAREANLLRGLIVRNALQQERQRQALPGFPAVERIAVEAEQVLQSVGTIGVVDDHRGREIAPQGGNWLPHHIHEAEHGFFFPQGQHSTGFSRSRLALQLQRDVLTASIQQSDGQGQMKRQLCRLTVRGRTALRHRQFIDLRGGIIAVPDIETGGTRLIIPALELRQIHRAGVLHGLYEIVRRDRMPIVTLEV